MWSNFEGKGEGEEVGYCAEQRSVVGEDLGMVVYAGGGKRGLGAGEEVGGIKT